MDSDVNEVARPRKAKAIRLWSIYRGPVLLVSFAIGLVLFWIWLPPGARAGLLTALRAQSLLVGVLFSFALIALSLLWSIGQRLDAWVFLLFNVRGYHPRWLDRLMWLATQIGNALTAFLLVGVLLALNQRRLALEVIGGSLTLWLVVETLKLLTARARPFMVLQGTRVIGWRVRGRSFPSGHTAQAFFLMTLFRHQFEVTVGGAVALYAVAVLVGFTRVYVGAHYPRDVIGGALLGFVWGVLATLIDPYWLRLGF